MGGSAITRESTRTFYERNKDIKNASTTQQVLKEKSMAPEFNPRNFTGPREACDSALTPESGGVVIAGDVTGSMSRFLAELLRDDIPKLVEQIVEGNLSYTPHIMFMGIGDVEAGDRAPLQVTQFEADTRMLEHLKKIYPEGRGGGNPYESYILAWYFAGKHIKMDCWDKRKKKGLLFTYGDELPTPSLTRQEINTVFGEYSSIDTPLITDEECLEMASEKFNCYHIILPGSFYRYNSEIVKSRWKKLMGSARVCNLSDNHALPELVTAIMKMHDGVSKTEALLQIKNEEIRKIVKAALTDHEEFVADVSVASGHEVEVF